MTVLNANPYKPAVSEKRYDESHWIRSPDVESALRAYLEQQSTSYSRIKNGFIRELLGRLDRRRFLDYGCGAGFFMVHAARCGAAPAVGVDAEPNVLETARHFAGTRGLAERCRFVCSRGFPFRSDAARFDVVLLKDVLEHVPGDRELLQAAAGVLAPGGCMVVSTQNAFSLNYLIEGTVRRMLFREKRWCGWDPTHVRFYTPGSLRNRLEEAGLEVTDWRSVYVIPHKAPAPASSGRQFFRIECLSSADRFLGRAFPFRMMGWNIMAKAIKR